MDTFRIITTNIDQAGRMWSSRPWLNKEDRYDRVKEALEDTSNGRRPYFY
jgi:hypothetical protein